MVFMRSDKPRQLRPPFGLRWRSSYWFTTLVVGLGVATDLLVYSSIIPVMPFQLQKLGYNNVSSLAGWLLFAYSAGLVISTIPIAMFSERYNARKLPLIIGLVILLGSQIMLMEAPIYSVMCIARILQGFGSSMVWVVGLALLCDSTPEALIGRQLGLAMSGMSIGILIGPPVGGVLYSHFGFRGPFIFGMGVTAVDLLGRFLIIERKDALPWEIVSTALTVGENDPKADKERIEDALSSSCNAPGADTGLSDEPTTTHQVSPDPSDPSRLQDDKPKFLSLVEVIVKLSKSSRALVALIICLVYGIVYTSQEPAIPLHLQSVWGLDSSKVGLIFLAAVVPTLISGPLSGWLSDRNGTEWLTFGSLILGVPWWVVVIVQGPLALFTVAFAVESFFTSGVLSPVTAELAAISRDIEGVGYAHVYGAFNIAFGIGSAIGPVAGGQMYDHAKHGWAALCLLAVGLLIATAALGFFYVGADPLWSRLRRRIKGASRDGLHE